MCISSRSKKKFFFLNNGAYFISKSPVREGEPDIPKRFLKYIFKNAPIYLSIHVHQ